MGLRPKPRSLSNRGEWLRGKRPFPGARFPSWEPIAPSGLLGLLSSRALSVPAVSRTGNHGCKDARGIGDSVRYSTFAQFNSLHFCSARYSNQLRLWFSTFAYLLVARLRGIALQGTILAKATAGTIRLRLFKVAAMVAVSVRRVHVRMAGAFPLQSVFRQACGRLRT